MIAGIQLLLAEVTVCCVGESKEIVNSGKRRKLLKMKM